MTRFGLSNEMREQLLGKKKKETASCVKEKWRYRSMLGRIVVDELGQSLIGGYERMAKEECG